MEISYYSWISKHIKKDNFSKKNVFITGGNSGIGFELAKQALFLGSNVFLLCRNVDKANKAKEELLTYVKDGNVTIIQLDLADFTSIENAAKEISKYDVDMFVNNAGVYRLPKSTTKNGFEIIMGTNFIGTLYLNDILTKYFSSLNHEVKVLFESSITSKISRFNFDDLFMDKKYKQMKIYGRSKLGVNCIYYTYLEELKNSQNIKLSLAHPGATYTPLIKKGYRNKSFEKIASIFMKLAFHTPAKASLSLLKALNDESLDSKYGPRGLLGLSGYPHKWCIRKDKNSDKAINIARELINKTKEVK